MPASSWCCETVVTRPQIDHSGESPSSAGSAPALLLRYPALEYGAHDDPWAPLDYVPIWERMQAFTASRDAQTADELWLLAHKPVFTQGQAGKPEHLLLPGDIPVVQIDRGGQVTYHGPGQLVAYLLMDVRRSGIGVRELVEQIENSVIDVLAGFGIHAESQRKAPGVYVNGAKIAALGLRIRQGCSYHGLSFNIDMDLSPFRRINPCGYAGLEVAQLRDLLDWPGTRESLMSEAAQRLTQALSRRLASPALTANDTGLERDYG